MPENIQVDISGAKQRFQQAKLNVKPAMSALVADLAGMGERFMKKIVPVQTGNLKNSVTSEAQGQESSIWSSANYALFVNDGTKPHTITPRRGKMLVFAPRGARLAFRGGRMTSTFSFGGKEIDTGLIFARSVHHPGTKPKRFIEKTTQHIRQIIPARADRIIKRITG